MPTAAASTAAAAAATAAAAIKSVLASGSFSSAAEPNNGVPALSAEGSHLMFAVQRGDRATVKKLLHSVGVSASFFIAEAEGPELRTPLRQDNSLARHILRARTLQEELLPVM